MRLNRDDDILDMNSIAQRPSLTLASLVCLDPETLYDSNGRPNHDRYGQTFLYT